MIVCHHLFLRKQSSCRMKIADRKKVLPLTRRCCRNGTCVCVTRIGDHISCCCSVCIFEQESEGC